MLTYGSMAGASSILLQCGSERFGYKSWMHIWRLLLTLIHDGGSGSATLNPCRVSWLVIYLFLLQLENSICCRSIRWSRSLMPSILTRRASGGCEATLPVVGSSGQLYLPRRVHTSGAPSLLYFFDLFKSPGSDTLSKVTFSDFPHSQGGARCETLQR